ncbi:MAG: hypothetical protein A2Z29_06635 [Chloroflexi bacterium RBG_16_56_11]|nr:MAG: hypothetical protein A2Z29_06635 [Chloroflexi bacterium RBG_16_56_11]
MRWWQRQLPALLMNALALVPLAWLAADAAFDRLSANPIQDIQLRTGLYAIILLTLSLASSPLYRLIGSSWLLLLRRLAGLYAVGYASLHLLNFLWLDYGFNLTFLRQDIFEKRYAVAGLAAYICLLPMVVYSFIHRRQQTKMRRYWRFLVYPAALLAAIHFIWQAKIDIRQPLAFMVIIVILLLARLPPVSRWLDGAGRQNTK